MIIKLLFFIHSCCSPNFLPETNFLPGITNSSHREPSGSRLRTTELAYKNKAFIIALQETHCTTADKIVIPNFSLAGSVLSKSYRLTTFVHERLKCSLVDQRPEQSETEWLCIDVVGYKIINVYKPPRSRFTPAAIPTFPHSSLYVDDFNCEVGFTTKHDGKSLDSWATSNNLGLLYNPKETASFFSHRWNVCANPDLTCKLLQLLPDGHVVHMIMEMVSNRSFTLTTGNSKRSRLRRLRTGIPQGSVLAPLFFNIYISDLPTTVSRKYAYADDQAIVHADGRQ